MNSALIKWLYLPDFFSAPNATNLISKSPAPHAHTPLPALLRPFRCPWDGQRVGTDRPLQPARGPSSRPHQAVQSCHSLWGLCSMNVPHPTGPSHMYTLHHTHTSAQWCGYRCACRSRHGRTRVWRLRPHGTQSGSRWPRFLMRVVQTWADTGVETEAAWHTVRLALASFPDACGLCMQIYMYTRKMHTGVLSDTHVHVHTVCRCWRKYARTFLPSCPHTPSPQDKGRAGRKWTALPGHDSGLPFAHR